MREPVPSAPMKIAEARGEVPAESVDVVVLVDVRRAGPEAGAVLLHGLLPGLGRDLFGEPVFHSHFKKRWPKMPRGQLSR